MSSSLNIFGNTIIYPQLNILILTKEGERILFRSYFLEWYFFSSLVVGAYFSYKILRRVPALIKKLYFKYKPIILKPKNLAVIFGFGDSLASIKVTKALINLEFDLILINRKESLEHRTKFFMNKNEHIEQVDEKNMCVSYEEILAKPEILKKKIGESQIDFIFDFTSFRITIDTAKIAKENEEMLEKKFSKSIDDKYIKINNKDVDNDNNENYLSNEKQIEKIEKVLTDKKVETAIGSFGNTNLQKKLNQSALQYYNSKIFYSEEISKHVNEVILITEYLIPFMDNTKIMIFNYKDKESDINHKLMVDFKKIFFDNLKALADKKNTIKYVKTIKGLINYKYKQFTEEDGIKIIRYSESRSYEYSFV